MITTPNFTFSDSVMALIRSVDLVSATAELTLLDGSTLTAHLDDSPVVEVLRNLDEPYAWAASDALATAEPGAMVIVYGIYYPTETALTFVAKHITLMARSTDHFRFEEPEWWVNQLDAIAGFYRRAQFGTGPIDFTQYRTEIRLGGHKTASHVQETDTISRLVYGMATAFLLTGVEEYLEIAEKGTEYLRDHMRFRDIEDDVVYWYHGIRVDGPYEHKLFTSEFGDDYDAVPMYEQIYALTGPAQTLRVTGDQRIVSDIEATLRLFEKYFRDHEQGGYFSHLDPVTMRPDSDSLGPNSGRKNWNSVGDHAPAYLINYYLVTRDASQLKMLEETFDLVLEHFCDPGTAPFVQERFHADWSPDRSWGWQQDRAVVGHNLKIAWNLTRINAALDKPSYEKVALEIVDSMPAVGADRQRGGWYDVVERVADPQLQRHRFSWHDRKAWWQQEQAILAYLLVAGRYGHHRHVAEARAAEAFYNVNFLDHDEGAVYFNVLASGVPYLLGTERLKGSHSMSMYHSAELCYLAAVYNNLLLNQQPLTLWFRPSPNELTDQTLNAAPDMLPVGQVNIHSVEVDGTPWSDFDAEALTVQLAAGAEPVKVKVELRCRVTQ
jgi:mannose/cellobiose epimerase-like protein (N-acyl-D-glucosamine 2-epimerase family)